MSILDTFYILFDTDAKKAEREMADVRKEAARTADELDDAARQAKQLAPALDKAADNAGRLGRSFSGLRSLLGGVLAGVAAGGGLFALGRAGEEWIDFTNTLRVAGLEGEALVRTSDKLFATSQRNGADLRALGQLYGRVTSASTELGVSQAEILQVTDAVGAAIRVQGGDAQAASGAMLQLAQAIGAGTVRAEEFNSINEGMLPLLQAAARASEKYGGSVARMRQDVIDGKLSSREFFDLIRKGSAELEDRAAKAIMKPSVALQGLGRAFARVIGRIDEFLGVSRGLSRGFQWAAENVELLGTALLVTAGILATVFAPAAWAAAAPIIAMLAPILAVIAAAAALGTVFALVAEDVAAFLNGQPSLIGELADRYTWFRAILNGIGVTVRVLARVFMGLLNAGRAVFAGLMSAARGWSEATAPLFRLIADVAGAVFGFILGRYMAMIAPWLPVARVVFGALMDGFRAVGDFFGSVFGAIGRWWDSTFGKIVAGIDWLAERARALTGIGGEGQGFSSGLTAGRGQLAAASGFGGASITSSAISNQRGGDRNNTVNMGGVNVNTRASNPSSVARAIVGQATAQFDDGVAK